MRDGRPSIDLSPELLLGALDVATGTGLALVDGAGRILSANPSFARLLGAEKGSGSPLAALLPVDDALAVAEALEIAAGGGRPATLTLQLDPPLVPCELRVVPLVEAPGVLLMALRDTSAAGRIEQHLVQSERLRVLGEMTLGLAHELNNLLSAIVGGVELSWPRTPELEIAQHAAEDAASILRRVQQFARPRAAHEERSPLDVRALVRDALEFTRVRWQTQAYLRGIAIRVEEDLEDPGPVLGAATDLREVFVNLILNAIDAMPEGGLVRITSRLEGAHAVVRVEDTGQGLSEEARARVFEPFFSTKARDGLGLGLSIVASIVGAHGGSISIESAPGEGARFAVYLPLAPADAVAQLRANEDGPFLPAPPCRVLVVEDNAPLRRMLVAVLRADGHVVDEVPSAEEAQDAWRAAGRYDLVVTDLSLPGDSGLDLGSWLQREAQPPDTLLVTAWGIQLEADTLEQHGIASLLSKPFRFDDLRRRIGALRAAPALG